MSLVIYKYALDLAEKTTVTMPSVCQILKIDYQDGIGPFVWALVDPDSVPTDNVFHVFGTGHPIPETVDSRASHLATFQQSPFVWHVFGPERLLRGNLR